MRDDRSTGEIDLPTRWLVVSVAAPPAGEELLLIDSLRRLGARAVERTGTRLVAHLPPVGDVQSTLRRAERVIRASTTLVDPALRWHWEANEAWLAGSGMAPAPRRVTERLLVVPVGHPGAPPPGVLPIRLHPGVAFGTAEHATTRACLRVLETRLREGDHVADVGSGSGILAIAAARLGAARVVALERDPLACATARRNLAANDVADRVEVVRAEATPRSLPRFGRFDGVVANLEFGILMPLLPALRSVLTDGGWLIVSGVLRPERDDLRRAAGEAGLEPDGEAVEEGWWCGVLRPDG